MLGVIPMRLYMYRSHFICFDSYSIILIRFSSTIHRRCSSGELFNWPSLANGETLLKHETYLVVSAVVLSNQGTPLADRLEYRRSPTLELQ